ncbi:MAG TPA: glycosyltransferase family 2 protein [Propylenella sp.]|nr:glycosyltransferase family 2 protein [Propylenella sp.]
MSVCLVAIAKNEAKFLVEWLAHYLSLGVDHIFVFDNDSTDGTAAILDVAARSRGVTRVPWPSREGESPQITAYNHALRRHVAGFEWVCFFDCDEFLVLNQDPDIHAFLGRFDLTVGAVAINWLTFGSGGKLTSDYELVTETFRTGAPARAGNNRHIKTIARAACVQRMGIHDCVLSRGRYIHPDGEPLVMPRKRGIATRIDHSLAQLNHYQIKSKADFEGKVLRGRAGKATNDPTRYRADPDKLFRKLDRNKQVYTSIDRNKAEREAVMAALNREIAAARQLSPRWTAAFRWRA